MQTFRLPRLRRVSLSVKEQSLIGLEGVSRASVGCILKALCWGWRRACRAGDRRLAGCKEIPYTSGMIRSRLTSKSQTTIPQAVRATLGLQPGDEIGYVVENGQVILTRVLATAEQDDPFATFSEWNSVADQQAYAGL